MRRSFPFVLLVTALLACRPDTIIASEDRTQYAGDYTLRSVNGFPLPYAVKKSSSETLEITDETFSLTAAGGFTDITHYRRTVTPIVDYPADTLTGTFAIRGQTVSFTTSRNELFTGTMGTSQFSIDGTATTLLYAK